MNMKILVLLIGIFVIQALADETKFIPNIKPTYQISETNQKIIIDAKLNEAVWQTVMVATNFSELEPGDNVKPEVKTEAFLTYDKEYLYFAMKCYDNPDEIRATWQDRDRIWEEDIAGIYLDTYGTGNFAYFIASNPLGIQGDLKMSSDGDGDENFDLIFKSEARITSFGYIVEMAIPFSSLRFPDSEEQIWRIDFWRERRRETYDQYSWVKIDRDDPCRTCQAGYLKGISGTKPGSTLDIIPSFVAGQTGEIDDINDPGSKYKNSDYKADIGITGKWAVTPSLTIEGTVNPDFSQVESDADQVDVNQTFALFFSEKRPFFQEGSDLIETFVPAVYTRSINNPSLAAKVIGRWESSTLGFISALDEDTPVILPYEEKSEFITLGRSLSNIGRYKHMFLDDSFWGFLFTDRRYIEGGQGSIISADFSLRFWQNYKIEAQWLQSLTVEPDDTSLTDGINGETFANGQYTTDFDGEKYWGSGLNVEISRQARHWSYDIGFNQSSPTFRTANGFVTQNDRRSLVIDSEYTFYYQNRWLERIVPSVSIGKVWNYPGQRKDEWLGLAMQFRFSGQTQFGFVFALDNERWKGTDFRDTDRLWVHFSSNYSEFFRFGFFMRNGFFIGNRGEDEPVRAKGMEILNIWATIKPTQRLLVTPSFDYADAFNAKNGEMLYRGYILRVRGDYQFTREMSLRLIAQYNNFDADFSFEPLISYKINPFSVFYLGYGSAYRNYSGEDWVDYHQPGWKGTSQQIFLKFQYLFNI